MKNYKIKSTLTIEKEFEIFAFSPEHALITANELVLEELENEDCINNVIELKSTIQGDLCDDDDEDDECYDEEPDPYAEYLARRERERINEFMTFEIRT